MTMQVGSNGYSEPNNRNIYRYGSYNYIGNDQFLYTFSKEDYNNAEDCNGGCE
ncbi:hypothetical protein [Lacinutrix mariniflava]|uniref:hypothetical protein n=1 Tax=Lacinutrix mariniflava TaxID=342955 RepID=UPI0013793311|nr:hypothetical protein [Lacinutrix mariniflava]